MSAVPALVRLPQGPERQFGKFALVVKLGWGGMADVYLAVPQGREPSWEDAFVVKRLKPDLVFDSEYRGMFKDEAKLALRLDHPNIVAAREMGEIDGQPYLAMEFLDGQPLDKILEASDKERLTRGEILLVMSELLAGMNHAHELKDENGAPLDIVHRDVSPHNVFITYSGQVKLVDFGIAKSREKAQHTSTGVVKGKIAYMAPEQALCSAVDKRADVFAAGVILWELITGKRFWGDLSDVQILKTMTFGDLPSLADHLPNPSPELVSMCEKALAITPDQRYASAAEFRQDVERFIDRLGERTTPEELGGAVARIAGDQRRALGHVIEQQFGRRSLVQRDDTPLGVEVPSSARNGGGGPSSIRSEEAAVSSREPSSLPSSGSAASEGALGFEASTLDPVSRSGSEAVARGADERLPAPLWQAPARKPSMLPWAALGVALVLGLAVVGVQSMKASQKPPAAPTVTSAEAPSAAPSATAAASAIASDAPSGDAAETAAESGDYVNVRITVTPSDAKVKLDGTLLPDNPFSAKFKKDGVAHRLTVEAPGYRSQSQMLVFDHDLDVAPSLDALASVGKRPQAPAGATSTPTGAAADPSDPWAKKKPHR